MINSVKAALKSSKKEQTLDQSPSHERYYYVICTMATAFRLSETSDMPIDVQVAG